MKLKNKTALITAAGQGIGRATAVRFRDEGARVIATDITIAPLADEPGIEVHELDVTDPAAIDRLRDELPRLDVLFNCAGMVPAGALLDCDRESWQRCLDLNVTSMFDMTRAFLPGMREAGGSIINMASLASSIKGIPNRCAYGMSKAAVIGLTKSIAADYMADGVRCNAICPGTVASPSLHERIAAQAAEQGRSKDEVLDEFIARQPMGRLGDPNEIAALAAFLASDEAAFITGTAQLIDGGWAN